MTACVTRAAGKVLVDAAFRGVVTAAMRRVNVSCYLYRMNNMVLLQFDKAAPARPKLQVRAPVAPARV
jgi:hypothetical protein